MIFQTAFLASLLGAAAAADITTATTTTATVSSRDAKIAEVKKAARAQLREKLAIPTSFSAKLEKFAKIKSKASQINIETTKFDEPQLNLRGLKMKDNFFSWTSYEDNMCMTPTSQFGTLVNYCMNEQGTESGVKKSYITKVNKKENLLVEIEYDGYDCKGVPSKVSDMMYEAPDFEGLGSCFMGPDGAYYTADYLSTYPSLGSMPNYYAAMVYPEDMCTVENMNYVEFATFPLDYFGIPFDMCIADSWNPGWYYMYSTSTCATQGQLTFSLYMDSGCVTPISTSTIFDTNCMNDDDDDYDDDDYDDDDDDDYELIDVITNEYCT